MKLSLLVSACALLASTAFAAAAPIDWAASVNGDFGNAAGAPLWDTGAGLQIPATDALDVEVDGGWGGAGPIHDWDGGGHLVWNGDSFRLAATAIYNHFSGFAGHLNESQLGGGAEWYPLSWLTIGAQGGGLVGTDSGYYAGGAVKFYPFPDLSLTGLGTYLSLNNAGTVTETDYGAKGEWVAFEEFPLGLTGSYTHANFGGLAHGSTDIWTVGLKLHINAAGEIPLVQHDRTGTLDTIASSFQFHF
jgi:hypothetical protein